MHGEWNDPKNIGPHKVDFSKLPPRKPRPRYDWEQHPADCPARAGSVYYCECGADPSRARGREVAATQEP